MLCIGQVRDENKKPNSNEFGFFYGFNRLSQEDNQWFRQKTWQG